MDSFDLKAQAQERAKALRSERIAQISIAFGPDFRGKLEAFAGEVPGRTLQVYDYREIRELSGGRVIVIIRSQYGRSAQIELWPSFAAFEAWREAQAEYMGRLTGRI